MEYEIARFETLFFLRPRARNILSDPGLEYKTRFGHSHIPSASPPLYICPQGLWERWPGIAGVLAVLAKSRSRARPAVIVLERSCCEPFLPNRNQAAHVQPFPTSETFPKGTDNRSYGAALFFPGKSQTKSQDAMLGSCRSSVGAAEPTSSQDLEPSRRACSAMAATATVAHAQVTAQARVLSTGSTPTMTLVSYVSPHVNEAASQRRLAGTLSEPHADRAQMPRSMPNCPECGGSMKIKTNQKGYNPGSKFLGCCDSPRCLGKRRLQAPAEGWTWMGLSL